MPMQQSPRRDRARGALIAADIVAFLGIAISSVALFLHGWIHATLQFVSGDRTGARLLQPFGFDVNKEIEGIADREIRAAISPTMWQYKGHIFQIFFLLLMVIGALLIVGLAASRLRIVAHALALLVGIGAVSVMVVAILRVRGGMSSLPAQIAQALLRSPIVSRALAVTTGTPQLDSGPGWPIYVAIGGTALMILAVLLALIFAATLRSRDTAIPRW